MEREDISVREHSAHELNKITRLLQHLYVIRYFFFLFYKIMRPPTRAPDGKLSDAIAQNKKKVLNCLSLARDVRWSIPLPKNCAHIIAF